MSRSRNLADIISGTYDLTADSISDGTITASKLAADAATQAELDAVETSLTNTINSQPNAVAMALIFGG